MATVGPPQPPPGSSSASGSQPPSMPPNSDQITWEGDKMFNIYILDYCKKRGYHKTASQLVAEAEILPESKPPINAQQGLLFEWWSVFWVLFQAKNSGNGSDDAILYTKYKFQQRGQVPPPQAPGAHRYSLPNGVTGPIPPLPNTQINGIGPAGQPPSLTAPPPYAPSNPATQPNGIPGPPPSAGPPGQPFAPGLVGRTPLAAQQRLPPQYQSPTIAPSPQSHGNPQQPSAGPMGQLGRSPHMSHMNRAAMPPPNGPQGPGAAGSANHLYQQQLGRPPSSHDTSSHHPMNPHPSPAMAGRVPPGQDRQHMDSPLTMVDAELAGFPPDLVGEAKVRANLGERDAHSLTAEEKQTILQHAHRLKHNVPPNGGVAGPSGANMPGQLQNRGPMAQPIQQQLSMQQQRGAKRNSTSPGEEHQTLPRNDQSPPDRKRLRKTPNPAEQQQQPQQSQPQQQSQQQPQQQQQQQQQHQQQQQQPQQPPMASISSIPPGPHPMSGSARGPMSMPGGPVPLNGFGGQMHPLGMGMPQMHAMSPSMMHGPPPGVMLTQNQQQQQQYRQAMANAQKNNPNVPAGPGDPQSSAYVRGPGPPGANRPPGQLGPPQQVQPSKPMGPPGQPGMNGPPKKDGEGELNPSLNPPPPGSMSASLLAGAPPMNPQRPPTASAPAPPLAPPPPQQLGLGDLHFDMTDMFSMNGDFDFNTNALSEMELYLEPDGNSLDMK